jgi:hypothetical protein
MARAPVFLALLCLVASLLASGADARKMVGVYVLKKGDFSVKMTNWGATIMSIVLPDSKGMMIRLCFDTQQIMKPGYYTNRVTSTFCVGAVHKYYVIEQNHIHALIR